MNVEINALESGQFWTYGSEKDGDNWKKLQIQLQNWGWAPDPSSATMWFTPDQVGIWNWERWRSDEYAKLHADALKELDPAKRGALYAKMQDLMEESGAYLFLTPGINPLLVANDIEPAVSPDGRRYFLPSFKKKA
jgi:peptide/nickel transport system substrate-binding protein